MILVRSHWINLSVHRLFFSKVNCCLSVYGNRVCSCESLTSNKEEADPSDIVHWLIVMLLKHQCISSPSADMDIMVLAINLILSNKERLFIYYGSGKIRKEICLSDVMMSTEKKDALFHLHAFSGNGYISSVCLKSGKTSS